MNLVAPITCPDDIVRNRGDGHPASPVALLEPGDAASPPVASDARGFALAAILGACLAAARGRAVNAAAVSLAALLSVACANLPEQPAVSAESAPLVAPATAVAVPAARPLPSSSTPGAAALDPLRPSVRIAFDDQAARADLWARLRDGYAMPDLDGPLVSTWETWYASRPDYVQRMTERGGRYLFYVVEEVSRRGLPTELALLPFIESAFNPQAMSTAKASGMWQFVPATGRDFSLTQNVFRDDRRDVLASTRAALDYLQSLYTMFGDWRLALAAYNWGQGNVQRALARNQKAGLPMDYLSLRMPDETRNYLPKLQAVKNIVARPEAFALTLPALANHPYFVSVPIERDIDVDLAAQLAGLPLDEFKQLNPQMNKPVILAAGTPQVQLPYDAANQFVRALARRDGSLASWTAWVAPRTVKPADLARQVGMPEAQLREVNGIVGNVLVKAGSTLLVPRDGNASGDVSEKLADGATLDLAPEAAAIRQVKVKAAKSGESVAAVAKRYGVSAAQVASWNPVAANGRFKSGQTIVLMLPRTPAKVTARSTATAAAAPARVPARAGNAAVSRTGEATRPARARTRMD